MYTWRLTLEYDGRAYCGWQLQPNGVSIQQRLEEALATVLAGESVRVTASGRTDAGVHALGQVVSLRCEARRPAKAFVAGLNSLLPPDIAVLEASPVPAEFHARYSAIGKHYRYRILAAPARSALRDGRVWHLREPLDVAAMQCALDAVVGEHDFSSFRARKCGANHPVRELRAARIRSVDDELWLEFHGSGFLRHMVRNLVGSAVEVGRGSRATGWMAEVLKARDRSQAGPTAPGCGLYLVRVDYPEP